MIFLVRRDLKRLKVSCRVSLLIEQPEEAQRLEYTVCVTL
jgi:hypothetical protein